MTPLFFIELFFSVSFNIGKIQLCVLLIFPSQNKYYNGSYQRINTYQNQHSINWKVKNAKVLNPKLHSTFLKCLKKEFS